MCISAGNFNVFIRLQQQEATYYYILNSALYWSQAEKKNAFCYIASSAAVFCIRIDFIVRRVSPLFSCRHQGKLSPKIIKIFKGGGGKCCWHEQRVKVIYKGFMGKFLLIELRLFPKQLLIGVNLLSLFQIFRWKFDGQCERTSAWKGEGIKGPLNLWLEAM